MVGDFITVMTHHLLPFPDQVVAQRLLKKIYKIMRFAMVWNETQIVSVKKTVDCPAAMIQLVLHGKHILFHWAGNVTMRT